MVIDDFLGLMPVLNMVHGDGVTGGSEQIAKIPRDFYMYLFAGDKYPALGRHGRGLLRCGFPAFPLNP
ncbi:MAG: hypothetical protein ACR2PS_07010 [Pseudomonadales bacterium]